MYLEKENGFRGMNSDDADLLKKKPKAEATGGGNGKKPPKIDVDLDSEDPKARKNAEVDAVMARVKELTTYRKPEPAPPPKPGQRRKDRPTGPLEISP